MTEAASFRLADARGPLPGSEWGGAAQHPLQKQLLKGDPDRIRLRNVEPNKKERRKPGRRRIRCPRCAWEPQRHDLWTCVCLFIWNTFDTGGVCPGCDKKWTETQCPRCSEWSRHEDWYEDETDDER